jgi:hypothetical protein
MDAKLQINYIGHLTTGMWCRGRDRRQNCSKCSIFTADNRHTYYNVTATQIVGSAMLMCINIQLLHIIYCITAIRWYLVYLSKSPSMAIAISANKEITWGLTDLR